MYMLIYILLVCYAFALMVQGNNGKPRDIKDRKGRAMRIGRNALPQRNKHSDRFDGFYDYDEAKDWVEGEGERFYAQYCNVAFDGDLYDDLYGVLEDDDFKVIVDGTPIYGITRFKTRLKVVLTLSHIAYMDDKIIFPDNDEHWGPYFVKWSVKVEGTRNPGHRYLLKNTIIFKKNGRIKEIIIESPDGHLSVILEQAKQIASAAFKVTDFIGDIAKSVNMEDFYLQYVVYIFFVILFGMAIIVILLTAVCVKVVLLGENKTKYNKVPATDNEL